MIEVIIRRTRNEEIEEHSTVSSDLAIRGSVQEDHLGYAGKVIASCLWQMSDFCSQQDVYVTARDLYKAVLGLIEFHGITIDDIKPKVNSDDNSDDVIPF